MTEIPASSGYVVSMIEYQGKVIIACQFAVYRVLDDDVLETILEVPHPPVLAEKGVME
jgi:hypothetical protein